MKSLVLRVSLKYFLMLLCVNSILMIISHFAQSIFENNIAYCLLLSLQYGIIAKAHYEFNSRNGNYVSIKDAFLIGFNVLMALQVMILVNYYRYSFFNITGAPKGDNDFRMLLKVMSACFAFVLPLIILWVLIFVESIWKTFTKAGKKGWASIVPIYDQIVLLQIVKMPVWYVLLLFIPIISLGVAVMIAFQLAKRFGKGAGFATGLFLLPVIFFPILGFGKAKYIADL